MIKFFKTADERPHPPELVGKEVGMHFRSYSLPLLVTDFSGERLYAKASERRGWRVARGGQG